MKAPEPIIRWMMLCSFTSNTAYSVCAPFLPLEFERHGLASSYVGMTFSVFALGNILVAPIVGKHLVHRIEARNLYFIGLGSMGICFILFGLVEVMESKVNILILAFALRTWHGIAGTFNYTTSLSIATNDFPGDRARVVGYLQSMTGAGSITGPTIGSALYSLMGFKWTFFVYGGLEVLLATIIKFNLPERTVHQS